MIEDEETLLDHALAIPELRIQTPKISIPLKLDGLIQPCKNHLHLGVSFAVSRYSIIKSMTILFQIGP